MATDADKAVPHATAENKAVSELPVRPSVDLPKWYVMRDLKRAGAKLQAWQLLPQMGVETFTPMVWRLVVRGGERVPESRPFMPDLIFAHSTRRVLDPIVERVGTLQYRYQRGLYHEPMTVRDDDMERFVRATQADSRPCFFAPGEVTPAMVGRRVRIVGGSLDGYEGHLQKLQGARVKRLFVHLPGLLTAAVEVHPDFIQLLKT